MKKFVFLFAVAMAAGGTYSLAHAQPAATSTVAARTYAEGQADGTSYAASAAAQYGYGTPEYQDAIDAASARATYNARNSEEPTYWRGYNTGLANY
jgi:hypothetical protein